MKRFLMFSVSVLCLALAALIGFYIGSHEVEAQVPGQVIGYAANESESYHFVLLENGDIYLRRHGGNYIDWLYWMNEAPVFLGNFWEGAVSTDKSSWGGIKGQFEK